MLNSDAHFIFGWMEAFSQSEHIPDWLYDVDNFDIEVINT